MKTLSIFIIFFLGFQAQSHAQTLEKLSCAELFTEQSTLFPTLNQHPLLERLVTGKIRQRFERSIDQSWQPLVDSIVNPKNIEFSNDEIQVSGRAQIENKLLEVDLTAVQLLMKDGGSVPLAERPAQMNMQFAKLISVLFSSIEKSVKTHPQITSVRIKSSSVYNPMLSATLNEMGFKMTAQYKIDRGVVFGEQVYDMSDKFASDWILELPISRSPQKPSPPKT